MVSVRGVSRRFGDRVALDRVSLEVSAGEVFGLLGPNGTGKTTLIRILSGVLPPSSGAASVASLDVGHQPEAVKAIIGYATQEASVYRDLTVKENLEFRAKLYLEPKGVPYAVEQILERFGLGEYAKTLAGALSGGGGSGSPSPRRWCTNPKYSSSTSPPPALTRSQGASCGISSTRRPRAGPASW